MAYNRNSSTSSEISRLLTSSHFARTLRSAMSVNLGKDKYSVWRSQVFPAVTGHNLDGFVFRTKTCPKISWINRWSRKISLNHQSRVRSMEARRSGAAELASIFTFRENPLIYDKNQNFSRNLECSRAAICSLIEGKTDASKSIT